MQRTTLSFIRNFVYPSYLFATAFILKAIALNMADGCFLAGLYPYILGFTWDGWDQRSLGALSRLSGLALG